ncbi:protease inhibitor 1, partial [Danaus plexippus plexippus]
IASIIVEYIECDSGACFKGPMSYS